MDGAVAGQVELKEEVFGVPVNKVVMHQVVVAHLANKRQGTQSALTRAEVSGGGIKPWRQKGTGRARQGSIRSPQWTKGGVVFAPKPRDYSKDVNKKVKRLAMKSALSLKVNEEKLIVLSELNLAEAKTKLMVNVLDKLNAGKSLVVLNGVDEAVIRACANIPYVKTAQADTLNVYDILNYDRFIVTQDAVKKIEEVYA
jgi:large subunit ribosomal protein L4